MFTKRPEFQKTSKLKVRECVKGGGLSFNCFGRIGKRCLWILVVFVTLTIVWLLQVSQYVRTEKFFRTDENNTKQSTSTSNVQRTTTLPANIILAIPDTSLSHTTTATTTSSSSLSSSTTTFPRRVTPTRTTPTTTVATTVTTRRPKDVSRYVSFSGGFADGRRLGNQIFCFAAVIYVAELTGREPAIERFNYVIELDKVFNLNVERFDSICPCYHIGETKHLAFDEATDAKVFNDPEAANKSIMVGGFRQSWRYTMAIGRRLRRHLVFKDEIREFSENFLRSHIPTGWKRAGFLRVAIHIRRSDVVTEKRFVDYGYTAPNETYFKKAMNHFTDRFKKVQFLTFSDDPKWTSEHINAELIKSSNASVDVTHISGHSAGQDLAIMSMCDHMIMSTGTYGWWAAWLAKGVTIYYENWPRNGSDLEKQFSKEDFFPPTWIPMTD